jgi:hypothetical protein
MVRQYLRSPVVCLWSIHQGLNASLAAKTMGHSLAVHHDTYHHWLGQADVAAKLAGVETRTAAP